MIGEFYWSGRSGVTEFEYERELMYGVSSQQESPPSLAWADWLNWPPAILLLIAALLKAQQLATTLSAEPFVFGSRMLAMLLIAIEIGLAAWLISLWRPRMARWVALGLFSMFSIFAAVKFFAGQSSCGCFGVVEVPPLLTLVVDIVMIGMLSLWPARMERGVSVALFSMASVAVLIIGLVLFPVLKLQASSLSDVGQVVGDGKLVVIEAEQWVGKRLSLAEYIEGTQEYLEGRWRMVLYREDYQHCQELIEATLSNKQEVPVVFVEVPPYGASVRRDESANISWGRLSDQHDWFVESPTVLEIEDATVIKLKSK